MAHDRHLPAINPLTARSVAISTLLGYHPPELPVSALIRAGGLFGIAERTTRVALSRMVTDGDVASDNGVYRLTDRLVRRQGQQDESCSPQTKEWDGRWNIAIVTAPARPLADRVAFRKSMARLRLAELREGVWIRPNNLDRQAFDDIGEHCTFFEGHYPDPSKLVNTLWDLPHWAYEARQLCTELDAADSLADGFMAIAKVLRHLLIDPCLPPQLLPDDWPGEELRHRYIQFNTIYAKRLREFIDG